MENTSARENRVCRALIVALALAWAIAFPVVALANRLQLYADGAMFSYAIGAQDVWLFHWRNISGRIAVWLLTMAPAEAVVALTRNPGVGVFVYGLLFYVAPLAGLGATFLLDRAPGRPLFLYACLSTILLCPLVFGFPTEMWLAHALFWPALTAAHRAPVGAPANAALLVGMLALGLTHEAALVLVAAIVATLAPRGFRDGLFRRAMLGLTLALLAEAFVKLALPPDEYFAGAWSRAARSFFDPAIFGVAIVQVLLAVVAGYAALAFAFARAGLRRGGVVAGAVAALGLAAYWIFLDHEIHATNRYYLRTAFVVLLPVLAALAAFEDTGRSPVTFRRRTFVRPDIWRAKIVLAVALVALVHVVETAKFVDGWRAYRAAVAALATGASNGESFVSSTAIPPELNRLSWFSTTPYLSVALTNFRPDRLVVEPDGGYYWLTCAIATASERADRAIPARTRALVREYACLHR